MNISFSTAFIFPGNTSSQPCLSTLTATKLYVHQQQRRQGRERGRGRLPLFSSSDYRDDTSPPTLSSSKIMTASTTSMINGATSESMLNRARKISNVASILCVLDCTLLPIITVLLPLLGVLNLGSSQVQAIDQLGHSLALFFVLPVGGTTTIINYLSHKKAWISLLAVSGLTMVGLANSHIHIHHWPALFDGAISFNWIGTVLQSIQGCGSSPWHRIVNVGGCSLLLSSNYLSQKQDECAHGCKGHDHRSHKHT